MLNRLPVDVNPFKLVEQRKCLTGVSLLQKMPRVAEIALAGSEDFSVELDFTRSIGGRPMIKGNIRGNIMLECQRCMQPVQIAIDCPVAVALTTFESDERPEQEGLEAWLVEDERLFIQDFVEDEILLALPLVARHEQCKPIRELIEALPSDIPVETKSGQTDETATSAKKNPFAVLKDWKKTE
jgi:uncharacterized protein